VRFWSEEFFAKAAELVNSDPRMAPQISGITTDIVADCTDRGGAYVIHVQDGKVGARLALPDEHPEFTFGAPYDEWVRIVRDSLNIRGEVLKGKVKFRGSMPKMLLYLGRVSRMEGEIIKKMRDLSPEY
jgi:putative sterol carrier protein